MRQLILAPESMAVIADSNKALFNPQGTTERYLPHGLMSLATGWSWFEDQNVTTHTVGPLGGTPLVNLGGADRLQPGDRWLDDGGSGTARIAAMSLPLPASMPSTRSRGSIRGGSAALW